MKARAAWGVGLLAVLAACASQRGADDPGRALLAVVSKGLPGVTIYDAASDRQICQVKMDVAPHEAAFSPGGRMLYAGPVVVTGLVSNEELATRSTTGYFEFCGPGVNERLIRQAGSSWCGRMTLRRARPRFRAAGTTRGKSVPPN